MNATSKLNGYFRYGHDYDDQFQLYQGTSTLQGIQEHPNPGTGFVATVNYTFSPTLVNQATYNWSYNYFAYFAANPAEIARSLANGAPGTPQAGQPLPSLLPLHAGWARARAATCWKAPASARTDTAAFCPT